ncbi:MAG: 1-deoxy-D-xylulose-5-phosphate synthase [Syntrophaceae bacterium PtaB.Bin038]|nr:MAG: 1-deoxy-D-xylulose-5-phosphate synthase [Syntrophaceae bacterium PtaB.Bin038]
MLERINSPADIKLLSQDELEALAEEIRKVIIETCSANGGHLAPSLGTVELTLALHYVFDAPRDKIVWDVGHQAYAHKLITGRRERFHTLRRRGGVCGFPRREESVYDVFSVGHSSTSISASAGIAEARCLNGESYKIVAVIGDGSMTAGMAFEGLNWAGDRNKDLIIVLNDNEMSISPNVGALSAYLNQIMTGRRVTRLRNDVKQFLRSIPNVGEQMVKLSRQAEEALKSFLTPGALFEELGFEYVGPLEGHRLDHLIPMLRNVKEHNRPVLVHVLTKKGKGYPFAELEPTKFHGIGPFNARTGDLAADPGGIPSYTEVFGRTMIRLARENPKIVAITAAMCSGTGLDAYAKEFPERFFDVGIAEQHGVTFAAGMATEGIVPVVAIYSTFMQRAYDQVLHDVCLQRLPVVLAMDRGGIAGDDGATHNGVFDFSYLRAIPNIVVMAPKDENELQHMLKTAVECGRPASVRYPRGKGLGVALDKTLKTLEIGRAEILLEGGDLAIFAIGYTVQPALEAARRLREEGIDATVVNCRFVKPLDGDLLARVALATGKVLTVEENVLAGGFGSAVLEMLETKGLTGIDVKRLGIPDEFVEHATQAEMRRHYGIDAEGILEAARKLAGPAKPAIREAAAK